LSPSLLAEIREAVREELRAVLSERPGDVLDVGAVQARYSLADPRAAPAAMSAAGAFKVGGRLFVQRQRLERWETSRVEIAPPPQSPRRVPHGRARPAEPLRPGFWRQ
jgi:hypothetical protein